MIISAKVGNLLQEIRSEQLDCIQNAANGTGPMGAGIAGAIRKAGGNLVEKVQLFDIYKGAQIPEGKKSIAYAIAYRDEKKTLEEKDITKVHDKILKALEHKLGAVLR